MSKVLTNLLALKSADSTIDAMIFSELFPEKIPSPIVESGYGWRFERDHWWLETGEDSRTPRQTIIPPRYTGSLEAALTLIPDGWETAIYLGGSETCVQIETEDMRLQLDFYPLEAFAPFPALAVCIACWKARLYDQGIFY